MRKSKTRISFFAFQDIITATTGILVLITIILTFFIRAEPPTGPTMDELLQEENRLNAEIDSLGVSIADLEKIIKQWGSMDPDKIKIDIERILALIKKYEKELSGLSIDQKKFLGMTDELKRLNMELKRLAAVLKGIKDEIERIKKTIRTIVAANKLFIIPEIPPGKKLLLIVMAKNNFEVIEFIRGGANKQILKSRAGLTGHLKQKKSALDYHIVFFVKPSGIGDFMAINGGMFRPGKPTVKDMGFRHVGWDPLEEHTQLDFSK